MPPGGAMQYMQYSGWVGACDGPRRTRKQATTDPSNANNDGIIDGRRKREQPTGWYASHTPVLRPPGRCMHRTAVQRSDCTALVRR